MNARSKVRKESRPKTVPVNLALQGGGSHGAFTWGVLDRLLEEPWIHIEGISGVSSGSMNAAILAHGFAESGIEGARQALETFWNRVSEHGLSQNTPQKMIGRWSLSNPALFAMMDVMMRAVSPYTLAEMRSTALSKVLEEMIDFERLARGPIKLFISATNVRSGLSVVFRNSDMKLDTLLASICLPMYFKAVEIEGESYWDAAFAGNPMIIPLIRECDACDTIIIRANPIARPEVPHFPYDVQNRLYEIAFNALLSKELRTIALLQKTTCPESSESARWSSMRIHCIDGDEMADFSYASKLDTDWAFLTELHARGRNAAELFLTRHGKTLGVKESFNTCSMLQEL